MIANKPAGFSFESDECYVFRRFGTRAINIEEGWVCMVRQMSSLVLKFVMNWLLHGTHAGDCILYSQDHELFNLAHRAHYPVSQ